MANWRIHAAVVAVTITGGGCSREAISPSNRSSAEDTVKATVDSCHDGDTCRIQLAGQLHFNVRLAGLDAPEVSGRKSGQPLGDEARELMERLVKGREVELFAVDLDHYNRPVVEIRVDGVVANLRLLEAGLAEVYRRAPPTLDLSRYHEAEQRARAAGLGIWGLARYESPAAFRRSANSRSHGRPKP